MTINELLLRIRDFLATQLFPIGADVVTISTMVTILLVVLLSFWLSSVIRRAMLRQVKESSVPKRGSVAVTARLVHYSIMLVGFGIALSTAGINLGALFTAGAVFAVAIGFAMQTITQNFVSGVILLFERSIKPGDVIELDGRLMAVRELGIRSTIARGLNEEDLIIPNSALVQTTVINYTLRDALYRVDAEVGVTYGDDMRKVREVLERVAEEMPWRSADHEAVVYMREFGSSSVNFRVGVFSENPWSIRKLRSDLNEAIWFALKDADITIAFPQLDIHFDKPVEEAFVMKGREKSS